MITFGKLDEAEELIRELRCSEDSGPQFTQTDPCDEFWSVREISPPPPRFWNQFPEDDRRNPEVAITYAIVLEQQGKVDEALAILQKALKSHELAAIEGIGVYFTLGDLYDSLVASTKRSRPTAWGIPIARRHFSNSIAPPSRVARQRIA